MPERPKRSSEGFVSNRFAVTVIAILFGVSVAGWIATELIPPDVPEKAEHYRTAWGPAAMKLVVWLHLYDPFHSFWYRLVLALFFVVLAVCVATRWRELALTSWRIGLPSGAAELRKKTRSFEFSWRLIESGEEGSKDPLVQFGERYGRRERIGTEALRAYFSKISSLLARRGYRVVSRDAGEEICFAASSGRWRSPGTMLFHIGILVITIGGVVGSFGGWRAMLYVREGGAEPLPPDSALTLRLDDFSIVTTDRMEIRNYISGVTILDARGDTVGSGNVEVNRPLKVRGRRIYQSEFTTEENAFQWAEVQYTMKETSRRGSVRLVPGKPVPIGGGGVTITGERFIPDFRASPDGPFSASSFPANPALEVTVASAGRAETGWLFLFHPDFNQRFEAPVELELARCEPVYYSGLEVTSSPGAPLLFLGFALATVGLLLMYLSNPRVLRGVADREAITMAGGEARWKASFEREFEEIRETIRKGID